MALFRINAGTVLDLEPGKQRKASFGFFTLPLAIIWWTGRFLLWALVNGTVALVKVLSLLVKAYKDGRD